MTPVATPCPTTKKRGLPMDGGEDLVVKFNKFLRNNDEAMSLLEERNYPRQAIDDGEVGYIPPMYDHYFMLMRGRVVVPIRDVHGRLQAFAGRRLPAAERVMEGVLREIFYRDIAKGEDAVRKWKAKWINEPFPKRRHLYRLNMAKNHARQMGYGVLVEGYFDADTLAYRHLPNVFAMCGSQLTEEHAWLIYRYTDKVVILTDGDEAGATAAEAATELLTKGGIRPFRLILPDGWDPDTFAVKYGGKQLRRTMEKMIEVGKNEVRIQV